MGAHYQCYVYESNPFEVYRKPDKIGLIALYVGAAASALVGLVVVIMLLKKRNVQGFLIKNGQHGQATITNVVVREDSSGFTNYICDYNFTDKLDAAVADKSATFEEITRRICSILADSMEEHLMDIQKINFDLTVLAINEPARAEKIIRNIKGKGNMDHLATVIFPYLFEAADQNKLHPKHDPMQLYQFISSAYVGIEANCILTACYGKATLKADCRPKEMFEVLATTIILLFGGNDK